MVRLRNYGIGLAAVAAIAMLLGAGWLMTRGRMSSPAALPAPVAQPRAEGAGSARLSWAPADPTAPGSDGPADSIAGFRIYVGPSPDAMQFEASVDDPMATSYVVERLPKGTFFFSVTTYTKLGIESPKSAAVSKSID